MMREPHDEAADGWRPPRTQQPGGSASSDPVCHPVVPCADEPLVPDSPLWAWILVCRETTLKSPKIVPFGMVMTVLILLLAACVHPSPPISASSSPASGASSSPQIEPTTGLESPESPTGGAVAISMAPAPTGNNGSDGPCVRVSWLGNPIPSGDIVTVTAVIVETPFTFDPAATANCGAPSCVNYRFSAANDNGQICYVGVGYTKGSVDPDGSDRDGHLELVGHLGCPSNVNFAACQRDAVAMQSPGIGTVRFSVPTIDKTSGPSSSPPESPTSPPPESPSSSPATPISSPPTAQSSA